MSLNYLGVNQLYSSNGVSIHEVTCTYTAEEGL